MSSDSCSLPFWLGLKATLQSPDQNGCGVAPYSVTGLTCTGDRVDNARQETVAVAIILLGAGKKESTTGLSTAKLGARLCSMLNDRRVRSVEILCGDLSNDLVIELAHGLELRSYRFDKYLTREDETPSQAWQMLS